MIGQTNAVNSGLKKIKIPLRLTLCQYGGQDKTRVANFNVTVDLKTMSVTAPNNVITDGAGFMGDNEALEFYASITKNGNAVKIS